MNTANFTYNEILSQTAAWTRALELASRTRLPNIDESTQVVFTGCGSGYYISLAASSLLAELSGRPTRAVPAGEFLLDPEAAVRGIGGRAVLVAISRSGTTTETLRAAKQWKGQKRGYLVVIGTGDAPLSRIADLAILIPEAGERSIAQTRAFTSMYLAAVGLCARMAGEADLLAEMSRLPEAGRRLIAQHEHSAQELGGNLEIERFYFLGSGIRYALACEANLKMKEMTLTESEAFHFLEFRHGPMSMVDERTLVAGLVSDAGRSLETEVLNEMAKLGARTLTLAESRADVTFESGVPEVVRAVLYLPYLQLMAYYRAVAKGLNPDRPRYLSAAVHLQL
jgi:glucosamine--fructose-6-phosphate aminotransferase (isomerizing)